MKSLRSQLGPEWNLNLTSFLAQTCSTDMREEKCYRSPLTAILKWIENYPLVWIFALDPTNLCLLAPFSGPPQSHARPFLRLLVFEPDISHSHMKTSHFPMSAEVTGSLTFQLPKALIRLGFPDRLSASTGFAPRPADKLACVFGGIIAG